MEIIRKTYVEEILTLKDKPFIKVITGVRRCGKSTILRQYRNLLVEQYKISKSNIISYDFNEPEFSQYSYMKLYKEIIRKSNKMQINYIFLDEIQEIDEFEKCVIGLFEHKKIKFDIYLTGSNSKMFSSSLASLLTGRNIEINIFPLSFKEYYEFAQRQIGTNNRYAIFQYYLKYGGLPIIIPIFNDSKTIERALSAVLKDSVDKDVKTRHEIRNYPEFLRLANYILENIGQDFSTRSISNYLKSNNLSKISHHTVDIYLSWMCEALILYKVNIYKISGLNGKKTLDILGKFYCVDSGIRNAQLDFNSINTGSQLENIVFIELLRRKYKVVSGRLYDGRGIDFIAEKTGHKMFIQVTNHINKDNEESEIGNLRSITINKDKIVLSLEDMNHETNDGIKIINLIDWLLDVNK